MTEPVSHITDLLQTFEQPKPPTIRKMIYRIFHLLVYRQVIRVEAKTKALFREVNRVPDAVRVEH